MKKYVMLIGFTLLAISALFLCGAAAKGSTKTVNCVKLSNITAVDSVICSGKIEKAGGKEVFSQDAGIIADVSVSAGEKVHAGQPLLKIYKSEISQGDSLSPMDVQPDSSQFFSGDENKAITVFSPAEGEIVSIQAVSGSYIGAGKVLMTIAEEEKLQVRLSVNESQISEIKTGQPASITGIGFKDSSFSGTVTSISSDAKQVPSGSGQEAVVDVIALINNSNERLKPGFTAKARIITSDRKNVVIVPYEAVQAEDSGDEYVYEVREGRAEKTAVKTGREYDNGLEIVGGLQAGSTVVLEPDTVSEGDRVIPELCDGGL